MRETRAGRRGPIGEEQEHQKVLGLRVGKLLQMKRSRKEMEGEAKTHSPPGEEKAEGVRKAEDNRRGRNRPDGKNKPGL